MPIDLIASAMASTPAATTALTTTAGAGLALAPPTTLDTMMQFAPMILVLGLMYFLLIRPQQKRFVDHQKMVKELRRGDRIITGGGVYGTIVKLEGEDVLVIEVADNVRIKVQRSSIISVANKTEQSANTNAPDSTSSAS
jgi:preprotein translocase subunit YajC